MTNRAYDKDEGKKTLVTHEVPRPLTEATSRS